MKHLIYLTYFGNGRFAPLLRRCIDGYVAAGLPTENLRILTDRTTSIFLNLIQVGEGFGAKPIIVTRVDPTPYVESFVRKGNVGEAFDYKSCLIMALLNEAKDAPCCILDCDNIILANFADILEPRTEEMWISPDPGQRTIYHPSFQFAIEQSSSCMIFPADARVHMVRYRDLWRLQTDSMENAHPLKEQRTWTMVSMLHGANVLMHCMAWSRHWDGQVPGGAGNKLGIRIRHPHGQEKWEGIET